MIAINNSDISVGSKLTIEISLRNSRKLRKGLVLTVELDG